MFVCFFSMYWVLHYYVVKTAPKPSDVVDKKGKKVKMSKTEYWFWYIEYASLFHAWLSIIWGAWSIYRDGTRPNGETTNLEYIIMMNSMGYFMFDLVLEIYLGILEFENSLHHACAVFPMVAAVFLDYGGSSIVALCFWSELSNP
jgi:hypothetical protein